MIMPETITATMSDDQIRAWRSEFPRLFQLLQLRGASMLRAAVIPRRAQRRSSTSSRSSTGSRPIATLPSIAKYNT